MKLKKVTEENLFSRRRKLERKGCTMNTFTFVLIVWKIEEPTFRIFLTFICIFI